VTTASRKHFGRRGTASALHHGIGAKKITDLSFFYCNHYYTFVTSRAMFTKHRHMAIFDAGTITQQPSVAPGLGNIDSAVHGKSLE
jgi:hypothetical protein